MPLDTLPADNLTAIPRGAILDLIGGISGYKCYWDGDGMDNDTTYVRLSIVGYRSTGIDETRTEYDPAEDQIVTILCGNRLFTLSIRVDSYEMSTPGYEILESIRRRLRGGAARYVLEMAGVSLTKMNN